MNMEDVLTFIHCTSWKGSQLGLERMSQLMSRLGNPQDKLRFIHVAGSNGKGSVCAMLSSILTAAGYQTGCYTSPHLIRVNERININGADISDEDLIAIAERVKRAVDDMDDQPTEFEIITAMSLLYFKERCCDLVVLEVGLGGRLDATNIIGVPEVAVLCNISLEHTEILGNTLKAIAVEKAGIIKHGTRVVLQQQSEVVENVMRRCCQQHNATLVVTQQSKQEVITESISGQVVNYGKYKNLHLSLIGRYQCRNVATVLETVECLIAQKYSISETHIRQGLSHTTWMGRFEVISQDPLVLLDGAHNPDGAEQLAFSLKHYLPNQKMTFLIGILADKDYVQMISYLLPYAKSFVCLTPDSARAMAAVDLANYLQSLGCEASACDIAEQGVVKALTQAAGTPVVACGSLYMIGNVRTQFQSGYKKWLRKTKIQARKAISDIDREKNSRLIANRIMESAAFQNASIIMSYKAVLGEVSLEILHLLAAKSNKKIVYPYCVNEMEMIALFPETSDAWKIGRFGILEPIPEKSTIVSPEEIDLVLCPCTAFDEQGNRIGMGSGYYDRFLEKCSKAKTAAAAFEVQKVTPISVASWDRAMDMVFTERMCYKT